MATSPLVAAASPSPAILATFAGGEHSEFSSASLLAPASSSFITTSHSAATAAATSLLFALLATPAFSSMAYSWAFSIPFFSSFSPSSIFSSFSSFSSLFFSFSFSFSFFFFFVFFFFFSFCFLQGHATKTDCLEMIEEFPHGHPKNAVVSLRWSERRLNCRISFPPFSSVDPHTFLELGLTPRVANFDQIEMRACDVLMALEHRVAMAIDDSIRRVFVALAFRGSCHDEVLAPLAHPLEQLSTVKLRLFATATSRPRPRRWPECLKASMRRVLQRLPPTVVRILRAETAIAVV
mmetsp:Transcript_16767/g.45825  ORF Transcript_16767/g.45825 Transcript_16767/m.45825 type:complete len:294 (-) Transcript_16767:993-1874(-)